MKITTKLALRYINKNKQRSIVCISSIVIATIFAITVFVMLSSFQRYMAETVRNKKNWEARFDNITFADVSQILNNENVKEISVMQKLGISEPLYSVEFLSVSIDVRAYDKKALINEKLDLMEGRLPENSREIVVKFHDDAIEKGINYNLNENLDLIINGDHKNYTIVGIARNIDFDDGMNWGGITYLDTNSINKDSIVSASILTKNIQKANETVKTINEKLKAKENMKDKETEEWNFEEIDSKLLGMKNNEHETSTYKINTELLEYECVLQAGTDFARKLIILGIVLTIIVMITSITLIYTSFKMTYQERIREFRYAFINRYEQKI
ncbi:MAG: ABC transporter permease [Clostridia bacterium]|nr:ABC transporter permease [Clostridia bacterium]